MDDVRHEAATRGTAPDEPTGLGHVLDGGRDDDPYRSALHERLAWLPRRAIAVLACDFAPSAVHRAPGCTRVLLDARRVAAGEPLDFDPSRWTWTLEEEYDITGYDDETPRGTKARGSRMRGFHAARSALCVPSRVADVTIGDLAPPTRSLSGDALCAAEEARLAHLGGRGAHRPTSDGGEDRFYAEAISGGTLDRLFEALAGEQAHRRTATRAHLGRLPP